jgi:acetyltransferase
VNEVEIRAGVLGIIKSIAPELEEAELKADRPLRDQIDLDSMDWLNVIAGLHERLNVEIPESDYGRLTTLDSIVGYVASRQAQRPGEPMPAQARAPAQLPCTRRWVGGVPVTVRPMLPQDMPLEADFVRHLSADTRYQRFMLTLSELSPAKLHYLTEVDQVRHVALAATVDRQGQEVLIGAVRYIVDAAGSGCEFAVAVDDGWQGSGLAGILMHSLMDVARSRGLTTMQGFVLSTNSRMLAFARRLGFSLQHDPEDRETVRVVRSL